jgi:hypothetical protein
MFVLCVYARCLTKKKGASLLFEALRVCGLGWKNNQTKKGASLYSCGGKWCIYLISSIACL